MNRSILRSIGIFTAVALVLLAVSIGGIQFVKNRSNQYAAQNTPSATTPQPNQGQQTPASPQNHPQSQQHPSTPSATPQSNSGSNPTPQVAPAPQQSTLARTDAPSEVPITGPAEDVALTIVCMMGAAYFGLMLKRARASYRRLLY